MWLGEESEYDSVCGWERKMRRVPGITLGLSGLAASAFAFFAILPASLHPVFSNTVFFFFKPGIHQYDLTGLATNTPQVFLSLPL